MVCILANCRTVLARWMGVIGRIRIAKSARRCNRIDGGWLHRIELYPRANHARISDSKIGAVASLADQGSAGFIGAVCLLPHLSGVGSNDWCIDIWDCSRNGVCDGPTPMAGLSGTRIVEYPRHVL